MPFKSKAQQRFMFAAESRGELPKGTARRWAHETPDIKKLPEKVEKKGGETLLEHVFSTKAPKHRHLKEKLSELVLAHAHDDGKGLDPKAIEEGAKIELEHTHSHATARQIAMDHLREKPDYYKLLKKHVEGEKKGEGETLQEHVFSTKAKTAMGLLGRMAGGALLGAGAGAGYHGLKEMTPKIIPHVQAQAQDNSGLDLIMRNGQLLSDPVERQQAVYKANRALGLGEKRKGRAVDIEIPTKMRDVAGRLMPVRVQGDAQKEDLIANAAAAARQFGHGELDLEGWAKHFPESHAAFHEARKPWYARKTAAKVEMEHTNDHATARQIAMDHLRERPDYYTRLKKMETAGDRAKEKKANYKLQGERKFRGLDIAIENKKGSARKWYDPHGKESGSTHMHHDYGYIRLTEGTDGDHVDVYVGPNEQAEKVFIVNQMKKPDFKAFDEQKVMLGFDSADAAKKAYLKQYNDPKFFGSMKEMDFEVFKQKVLDKKNHGQKIASGDMLQYFMDHPEKLKEKRERDRKKAAAVLHMADGTIYGGAAADSQVGFPKVASDIVRAARDAGGAAKKKFRVKDFLPRAQTLQDMATRGGVGAAGGALAGGLGAASEGGYESSVGDALHGAASGAVVGGALGAGSVPLQRLGRHLVLSAAPILEEAAQQPQVLDAAGNVVHDFGEPLIRKAKRRGIAGLAAGVGSAVAESPIVQLVSANVAGRRKARQRQKEAALSPAMLSHLGHGAAGAGIGAVAGGLGGMAHASPDNRGQGFLRGALVGAGLGAAGGAGVSAIKQHGAQQLAALRTQAGKAHQEATAAHTALQNAPTVRNTQNAALAATEHASLGVGAGTLAGKPGAVGRPAGGAGAVVNTQGRAVMDPAAWGHRPPTSVVPHDIAAARASSAGGRAEALRQAAETLGQQHEVMNKGINRAALTGAAVGTGLMGYMAVPRQYGGVGVAQKTAEEQGRVSRIADRLDDVGIGLLASPYIADAAAGGLKRVMLRGGRLGALAAEGHTVADALAKRLHNNNAVELGGLALVAPGVIHPIAKKLDRALPAPTPPAPHADVIKAAEEAGRALANTGHVIKISGLGRLALGLGAVGATGAALYGGKKAIDTTKELATHHAQPARYVGVPPGMRPPAPAGV